MPPFNHLVQYSLSKWCLKIDVIVYRDGDMRYKVIHPLNFLNCHGVFCRSSTYLNKQTTWFSKRRFLVLIYLPQVLIYKPIWPSKFLKCHCSFLPYFTTYQKGAHLLWWFAKWRSIYFDSHYLSFNLQWEIWTFYKMLILPKVI